MTAARCRLLKASLIRPPRCFVLFPQSTLNPTLLSPLLSSYFFALALALPIPSPVVHSHLLSSTLVFAHQDQAFILTKDPSNR